MSRKDEYVIGLNTPLNYSHNFNPINFQLCLLLSEKAFLPTKKTFRYLELGCGNGVSLNIHAATQTGEFWGVEPAPDFALEARALADASAANVKIYAESFAQFVRRQELPEFDIVVVTPLWGMLSSEEQSLIINFIGRHLAVGGIFCVNYKTPLGENIRMISLSDLMKLHYERTSNKSAGTYKSVKASVDFIVELAKTDSNFARNTPFLNKDVEIIKNTEWPAIAHDYLENCNELICFSEMADILSEIKLKFSAHGRLVNNIDSLCLPDSCKNFLDETTDVTLKEVARDFLSDHQQRCDLWLKGARILTLLEKLQLLGDARFALVCHPQSIKSPLDTPTGKIDLPADVYEPILECLAENHYAPKSVNDLVDYYQLSKLTKSKIVDALVVLASLNLIRPAQKNEMINKVKANTNLLNIYLLEQAVHSDRIGYLASPVIGGGIPVSRIEQLFLLACREDVSAPDEWASLAWQLLSQQNKVTMIEDQTIKSSAEGVALLKARAHEFADKKIPMLKALCVIE